MLGFTSISAALALATQGKPQLPPINPDRPDFTDSAYIIPKGTWQTEVGWRQLRANATTDDWGNQPLIRYGVNEKFEWRLALPSYQSQRSVLGSATGYGDGLLGFKYRIRNGIDNKVPSLAVILTTTVPSRRAFSDKKLQPQLVFVIEQVLGVYNLQVNLMASYLSAGGNQFSQFAGTYSLGYPIKGKLGGFFEGVWNSVQTFRGPRGGLLHAGLNYLVTNDLMVDCAVGQGVNGLRKDMFLGLGFSYRF